MKVTFLQRLENLTRRQEKKPSAWGISGVFDGCHFQMEKMLACVRYRCVGMNALYDCIAFIRVEIENWFAFDMRCLLVFWMFTLTKSNTPKICSSNLIKMINSSISSKIMYFQQHQMNQRPKMAVKIDFSCYRVNQKTWNTVF